jgi:rhodanese-related sulfurtransferase
MGTARAALSGQTLKAMGYTNVSYMAPGYNGWTEADLPVVKPGS